MMEMWKAFLIGLSLWHSAMESGSYTARMTQITRLRAHTLPYICEGGVKGGGAIASIPVSLSNTFFHNMERFILYLYSYVAHFAHSLAEVITLIVL